MSEFEIWKPVRGYEGIYEVSNIGRVKSLGRLNAIGKRIKTRVLRHGFSADGYPLVVLCNGSRSTQRVHRLVAEVFIPNPDGRPEVNHINGVKTDNRVSNLEWVTTKENAIHAFATGLRENLPGEHNGMYGRKGELFPGVRLFGEDNPMFGRTAELNPNHRKVIATAADGVEVGFYCLKQASEFTGAGVGNITSVCRGQRKSAAGYSWRYVEDVGA